MFSVRRRLPWHRDSSSGERSATDISAVNTALRVRSALGQAYRLSTRGRKRLPLPLRPSIDRWPFNQRQNDKHDDGQDQNPRDRLSGQGAKQDDGRRRSKGDDHVQDPALRKCPSAHPAGGDAMLLGVAPQTGNSIVIQGAQPARRSEGAGQPGDNGQRNTKDEG